MVLGGLNTNHRTIDKADLQLLILFIFNANIIMKLTKLSALDFEILFSGWAIVAVFVRINE